MDDPRIPAVPQLLPWQDVAAPPELAIGGMSVDAQGSVYNTNFHESVWRTSPDGETVLLNDEFSNASGNFALSNGDLLQADYKDNEIYRIEPDGSRSVFATGGMDGPVGIVQRPGGDFIVANHRGKFLVRIPEEGGSAEVVAAGRTATATKRGHHRSEREHLHRRFG